MYSTCHPLHVSARVRPAKKGEETDVLVASPAHPGVPLPQYIKTPAAASLFDDVACAREGGGRGASPSPRSPSTKRVAIGEWPRGVHGDGPVQRGVAVSDEEKENIAGLSDSTEKKIRLVVGLFIRVGLGM